MISIIVPVYNVQDYIIECLESVSRQSYKDFECLIIDDGSKDNSINLALEYIKGDDRFKVFHKENGGLSDARNYGLSKASGEYVFFLDSDDYIHPQLLELAYKNAKEYDSDIVIFDLIYHYDDHDEITVGANFEVSSYKDNKDILYINNSANDKLFRYSFIKDKKFIKGIWYEDLASIPVWISQANKVSHVNKALYYYRQRSGSISHVADKRLFDIYKALNNIKKELKLNSLDIKELYIRDALIMNTLKIAKYDSKDLRLEYYQMNMDHLNKDFKEWYDHIGKVNLKRRILFYLLKKERYQLLDKLLNH